VRVVSISAEPSSVPVTEILKHSFVPLRTVASQAPLPFIVQPACVTAGSTPTEPFGTVLRGIFAHFFLIRVIIASRQFPCLTRSGDSLYPL